MEIIFSSKELDKRSLYKHTRGQGTSLKDVDNGTIITPAEIVLYEDTNSRGDLVKIVSIVDATGKHYVSGSPYFCEELLSIAQLMEDEPYKVMIVKKQSKAGRVFTTCELV